jgi:hypothetical protein
VSPSKALTEYRRARTLLARCTARFKGGVCYAQAKENTIMQTQRPLVLTGMALEAFLVRGPGERVNLTRQKISSSSSMDSCCWWNERPQRRWQIVVFHSLETISFDDATGTYRFRVQRLETTDVAMGLAPAKAKKATGCSNTDFRQHQRSDLVIGVLYCKPRTAPVLIVREEAQPLLRKKMMASTFAAPATTCLPYSPAITRSDLQ